MLNPEYWLTALIVVLLPGTGVIYTLSMGLLQGKKASFFAALGCTTGIIPHLLASVSGLAALLHSSAVAFQVLKYLGVIYLLWLAWNMWKDNQLALPDDNNQKKESETDYIKIAQRGFLINILNPKLSIFFLAFLPQFLPSGISDPTLHLAGLSSIFMMLTFIVFIGYGFFAHQVRQYIEHSPKILHRIQKSFSLAFIAMSVRLAVTEK